MAQEQIQRDMKRWRKVERDRRWKKNRSILRWKWKRLFRVKPSRHTLDEWVRWQRESQVWQPPPPSHYVLLLSHCFHYEPRGQSHDWENSRQSRRERLKKEWEAEKEKDSGLDGTEGRWKLSNRTWKQSRARRRRRREDEGGKTKECEPWKVNVETAASGRII